MPYWKPIGEELLERDLRPMAALSREGEVLSSNQAMRFLLGVSEPTEGTRFQTWLSAESIEDFNRALASASSGQQARVSLQIARAPFDNQHSIFDLWAMRQPQAPLLIQLVEVVPRSVNAPLAPLEGITYEVALDVRGRPSKLLRASRPAPHGGPDVTCYEALHGRSELCDGCPVKNDVPVSARVTSPTPFGAELVKTRRMARDVAVVTIVPLGDLEYRAIVQARVEALGQKARLTQRERRVFDLLLMGRSIGEVAAAERVSPRTAKYHQQNLLRKLGAESRLDLLRLLS